MQALLDMVAGKTTSTAVDERDSRNSSSLPSMSLYGTHALLSSRAFQAQPAASICRLPRRHAARARAREARTAAFLGPPTTFRPASSPPPGPPATRRSTMTEIALHLVKERVPPKVEMSASATAPPAARRGLAGNQKYWNITYQSQSFSFSYFVCSIYSSRRLQQALLVVHSIHSEIVCLLENKC